MTALTPGGYVARRREHAGLSLQDVARAIDTEPHLSERERLAWIALIEADLAPLSGANLLTLFTLIGFDPVVLQQLNDHQREPARVPAPRLCRVCACSDRTTCLDRHISTYWAAEDLCSVCALSLAPLPIIIVQGDPA